MGNKAVFLDRDGVLNKASKRPPNNAKELVLLPGAAKAVRMLKDAGFQVFVVTNQGGVGLGYMTEEDLAAIHAKLVAEVEEVGGSIDEVVACTHKPREGCECRKPKPGMILTLAEKYDTDLPASFMVGDREGDIEAGMAAGTRTIFIGDQGDAPEGSDCVAPGLDAATQWILSQ